MTAVTIQSSSEFELLNSQLMHGAWVTSIINSRDTPLALHFAPHSIVLHLPSSAWSDAHKHAFLGPALRSASLVPFGLLEHCFFCFPQSGFPPGYFSVRPPAVYVVYRRLYWYP